MKDKETYSWIAKTARLVGGATFHSVPVKRDGATRISVQVEDERRVFIISSISNHPPVHTPHEVREYFSNLRPRDSNGGKIWPPSFVPALCGRCGRHRDQHEVPGYLCPKDVATTLATFREAVSGLLVTKYGTNPHEAHCTDFRNWPEVTDCECIVGWATRLLKKTDAG